MRPVTRPVLALTVASLLAGCAELTPPPGSGPLTQGDTARSVTAVSAQLQAALMRAANDEGVLALQGFPFIYNGTTDPLAEVGYAPELPRGVYRYDESSSSWLLEAPSDDLSLSWPYSDAPFEVPPPPEPEPTPEPIAPTATREATLVLDWNANSPTRTVRSASGSSAEVPTGLNVMLTADNETAADLDADLSYYSSAACPAGILEPTALSVNGTSSVLTFDNVGYSLQETETGDTLSTAGRLTLADEDIYLDWDIAVTGDLARSEDCFSELVSFSGGSFAAELGGFTGDTRSIALRFNVADLVGGAPLFSDGEVVINGDETRAVTFEGPLSDDNGNGVPGDSLNVTFPDGSRATLEQLLQDWYEKNPLLRLLKFR